MRVREMVFELINAYKWPVARSRKVGNKTPWKFQSSQMGGNKGNRLKTSAQYRHLKKKIRGKSVKLFKCVPFSKMALDNSRAKRRCEIRQWGWCFHVGFAAKCILLWQELHRFGLFVSPMRKTQSQRGLWSEGVNYWRAFNEHLGTELFATYFQP